MAWEDLRNDLESVSRYLEDVTVPRNVDGLLRGVEGFRAQFEPIDRSTENADKWDRLVRILNAIDSLAAG